MHGVEEKVGLFVPGGGVPGSSKEMLAMEESAEGGEGGGAFLAMFFW